MKPIILRLFIIFSFIGLCQDIEGAEICDTNIYYVALREYFIATPAINEFDSVLVLNKSRILLPNKIDNKTLISVDNDQQLIHHSTNGVVFEIFPKKRKGFHTEISILNFYVDEEKLTVYGSVDLMFRMRLLFGKYRFMKLIKNPI